MRGKALLAVSSAKVIGITPAYAGKRCLGNAAMEMDKDHPRLCGEKILDWIPRS